MPAEEPTVLGLLVDGQARLEANLSAMRAEMAQKTDLARFEGELKGLKARVDKVEATQTAREATETGHRQHAENVWTRRNKAWAASGVVLTILGIWFGPVVASAIVHH